MLLDFSQQSGDHAMSSLPTRLPESISRPEGAGSTRPASLPVSFIKALDTAQQLLAASDVRVNGDRPWDLQIHHPDTLVRALSRGSLGLGESYMDGWWVCVLRDFCLLYTSDVGHQLISVP